MSLKITQRKESRLLKRSEIKGEIGFAEKATPSNADVAKMLAAELKAAPECIVLRHVHTKFGDTSAKIDAYVYESKEAKDIMEPKMKVKAKAGEKAEEGEAGEKKEPAKK
jgi:ribosomal protein S24E